MVQRSRGRGDVIPHSAELLKVLGDCRKRVIDAHTEVRPFGAAYDALSMVTTAIDALATFMTGHRDHFSIGGSVPPEGSRNMILPPRED